MLREVLVMQHLVDVRSMLSGDVEAAYDGDPAALNCDEVILAYLNDDMAEDE